MEDFFERLEALYTRLADKLHPLMEGAICGPGCAFCCTGTGSIDISTLEGLRILMHLESLPLEVRTGMRKAVAKDRKNREQERRASCPFLDRERRCRIYPIRPLVCRRLYSLEPCEGRGPLLHKEAIALGREARDAIQRLDLQGYSGHISYVLELFDEPGFRKLYTSGGFDPSKVMAYGRKHKLVIHRSLHGRS